MEIMLKQLVNTVYKNTESVRKWSQERIRLRDKEKGRYNIPERGMERKSWTRNLIHGVNSSLRLDEYNTVTWLGIAKGSKEIKTKSNLTEHLGLPGSAMKQ